MLIDKEAPPERNIYFLGSKILKVISTFQFKEIPLDTLYGELQKESAAKVSFSYFMLALDWLFILELITTDSKGDLVKCF